MPTDLLPKAGRLLAILVRHAQTALNTSGKLRAWEDVPLNADGQIDSRITAKKIEPYKPQMLYHSDLLRDTMTGNIIGEYLRIPSQPDFDLRTSDMGEWTGMDDDEVLPGIVDWYKNPYKKAPGNGDSYYSFCNRFFTCVDSKLELAKLKPFNPIVMVAHGRNFAALDSRYSGVEPWLAKMPFPAGYALIIDNGYGFPPYKLEFVTDTEPVLSDL